MSKESKFVYRIHIYSCVKNDCYLPDWELNFSLLITLEIVVHLVLNFNLCFWELAFVPDQWLLCSIGKDQSEWTVKEFESHYVSRRVGDCEGCWEELASLVRQWTKRIIWSLWTLWIIWKIPESMWRKKNKDGSIKAKHFSIVGWI